MHPSQLHAKARRLTFRGVARAISHFSLFLASQRNPFLKGPRRRKAIIIGINYTKAKGNTGRLSKSCGDALEAKKVLIEAFRFKASDIVTLVDSSEGDGQPTHAEITTALEAFVNKDETDVDYVFIYSGHASQSDAKGTARRGEEDGRSEFIMPVDSWSEWERAIMPKVIYDHQLRDYLVERLGKGCKLLAIFDSCHSATLLNLKHHKCHRGGRCTSFVRHMARRVLCDPFHMSLVRAAPDHDQASNGFVRRLLRQVPYRIRFAQSDDDLCTGFCHREQKLSKYPRVVCISGCKDSEMTFEHPTGASMLRSLLQLLQTNRYPTFQQVMNRTRANVKEIRYDRINAPSSPQEADPNFDNLPYTEAIIRRISYQRDRWVSPFKPWHPEMSAEQPVDMKQRLVVG